MGRRWREAYFQRFPSPTSQWRGKTLWLIHLADLSIFTPQKTTRRVKEKAKLVGWFLWNQKVQALFVYYGLLKLHFEMGVLFPTRSSCHETVVFVASMSRPYCSGRVVIFIENARCVWSKHRRSKAVIETACDLCCTAEIFHIDIKNGNFSQGVTFSKQTIIWGIHVSFRGCIFWVDTQSDHSFRFLFVWHPTFVWHRRDHKPSMTEIPTVDGWNLVPPGMYETL